MRQTKATGIRIRPTTGDGATLSDNEAQGERAPSRRRDQNSSTELLVGCKRSRKRFQDRNMLMTWEMWS